MKSVPKAVVLGLYGSTALGVIRSLGIERMPVVGFHYGLRFPHASYSKYLHEKYFAPDEEGLLEKLIRFGEEQDEKGVIFCTGDNYVLFVQRNADKLNPLFRLPLSEYDTIDNIIDKSKILDIGQKAGFNVPPHAKLSSEDVFNLEFPVFIKPLFSVRHGKSDMLVIRSKEELRKVRNSLLEKYGEMEVEKYIHAPTKNKFEVHTYLTSKGEALIAGMLRFRTDFAKPGSEYHNGWSRETVNQEELIEPSMNLTRLLKFRGPLDINIIKCATDNKFYFNEVNLRSSANLMSDTAFGLNLPAIVYLDQTNQDYSALAKKKRILGQYWIHDRALMYYASQNIEIDFEKLLEYIQGGAAHSFWDPKDPLPFYISLIKGYLPLNLQIPTLKNNNTTK